MKWLWLIPAIVMISIPGAIQGWELWLEHHPAPSVSAPDATMTYRVDVKRDYPLKGSTTVDGTAILTNVRGAERWIEADCRGVLTDGSGLIVFVDHVSARLAAGRSEEELIYGQATRQAPMVVTCELRK